jgi:DNA-binding response OmpR family regulator
MGDGRRILLVEDDAEILELLGVVLHDAGYDVDRAASFTEGEAKLAVGSYDLVVSDVLLPGGLGTFLAQIADAKGIRTLLVTGDPDQMQILELRQQPYLEKPFLPARLVQYVKSMWPRE